MRYRLSNSVGLTLVEMIVTLALAGILLFLAVPNFRAMIQNNRVATTATDFVSMLSFARSEAIKRASPVVMCAASDQNLSSCVSATNFINDASWREGWIVFVDSDDDGQVAAAADILKVHEPLPSTSTISSTASTVRYQAEGLTTSASTFTILATGCTGTGGRVVSISAAGTATVTDTACP